MINKTLMAAISIGSSLTGQETNQENVNLHNTNLNMNYDSDLNETLNDSYLTRDKYYDELMIIKNQSHNSFNDGILKHANVIIKRLLSSSKNVEITYINQSAIYSTDLSKAKFIATPTSGHSWKDFSTNPIIFEIEILNVEVDDIDQQIKNDARMPYHDAFNLNIVLDEETDEDMNDKILALNLNLENHGKYLVNFNKYKNVRIDYIQDTTSYENSTFKILVTPNKEHYWENKTQVSYICTVVVNNLEVKPKLIQNARVLNLTSYDGGIDIESKTNFELDKICREIDWDTSVGLQLFNDAKIENVKLFYVDNSAKILGDEFNIALEAIPNENHSWIDSNQTDAKKFYIKLNNVFVNEQEEIEISQISSELKETVTIEIEQKELYQEEQGTYSSETTVKRINIPKYLRVDLWWNQEFKNTDDVLNIIFTDNNLWSIFKIVEEECKGIEALYWIKNSPKLLSWSEASIDIGVLPKEGYAWNDGQKYERKLNIIVGGFYINAYE